LESAVTETSNINPHTGIQSFELFKSPVNLLYKKAHFNVVILQFNVRCLWT